jgi:hypothetical protein
MRLAGTGAGPKYGNCAESLNVLIHRIDELKDVSDCDVIVIQDAFRAYVTTLIKGWGTDVSGIVSGYAGRLRTELHYDKSKKGHRVIEFNAAGCWSSLPFRGDWYIRPEYYEVCQPNLIEKLCMLVDGRYIRLWPIRAVSNSN